MALLKVADEEAERVRQERLKAYEAKQAKSKFLSALSDSQYRLERVAVCHVIIASLYLKCYMS